jgi:hypothetical protein
MRKIFSKMKLNRNNNKILVSLQLMKKKLIPLTNFGKISVKILNLVWYKIGKTEINLQYLQDGIQATMFLN